ncbi:hypothetical protein C5167_003720, partial [Papaver somniferum]
FSDNVGQLLDANHALMLKSSHAGQSSRQVFAWYS